MLAANKKITIRQLQILILLSSMGTGIIVLPRRVAEYAGQDGWIITAGLSVVAVLLGLLICAAVSAAVKARPGAGFIEFTSFLLSRPVAYACGVVLWLKLVISAGLELRVFLEITRAVMLPNTPFAAVSIVVLLVCAYAAIKGIETRARVAEVLFAVMVLPFIFLVVLAFIDTDFSNLQPVLSAQPRDLMQGVLRLGFIFTGLECLLLVSPFIRNREKMGRHVAGAIVLAGGIILLITILTIAKFGRGVADQPWPVLRMMDMINIPGSFIERQEVLMFSFWIITAFAIGNTMLFFGGLLVKDMFKLSGSGWHVGVLFTAVAVFAVSIFPWGDVYRVLDVMFATSGVFFLVVLPVLLLIAAKLRNKIKKPITLHKKAAVFLLLPLFLLSGCWDAIEIENRAFVVSIGIDATNDGEYTLSICVPLLKKGGSINDADEPHHIKTATAPTISEAVKKLDAATDKTLYYGQAKLLVLGSNLMQCQEMLAAAIHAVKSKPEVDLRINVLAAHGLAEEILEAKPPGETLPGVYVADIYRSKHKLGGNSFSIDLERLVASIGDGDILPMVKLCNDADIPIVLHGAAVINNYRQTGHLSPEELQSYLWSVDHGNNSAVIAVEVDNSRVPVKITRHKAVVAFDEDSGNLRANITVNVVYEVLESHTHSDSEIEAALQLHISNDIAAITSRLQGEFNLDGYDWLELLRKKNYSLYMKYHENWLAIFSGVEIIPHVAVESA